MLSHYGDCGLKRRIPTNGTLSTLGRCAPYTLKPGGDKALDHRRASACPKIMSLQWESRVSVVQVNRPPPPVRHHRRVARPDVRPALRGVGFTGGVRY